MLVHPDLQYNAIMQDILENGEDTKNRTPSLTRTVYERQMRVDLAGGFPILTTKRVAFRLIAAELLWFLKGSSDVRELRKLDCHIWDDDVFRNYLEKTEQKGKYQPGTIEWEDAMREFFLEVNKDSAFGDRWANLGPVYGVQWRRWRSALADAEYIDQLGEVVESIRANDTDNRRNIVSAWRPDQLESMVLPPCHMFYRFHVSHATERIHLFMYQRSCDMFLGVPFNLSSYALLLSMVAHVTGFKPGEFIHQLGNAHIYHWHFDQVREQISREPKPLPKLWLNPDIQSLDDFWKTVFNAVNDGISFSNALATVIRIDGYNPHPAISAPLAV